MLIDVLEIGLDFSDAQACSSLGFTLSILQDEINPAFFAAIISHIPNAEFLIAQAWPYRIGEQAIARSKGNTHRLQRLFADLGLDSSDVGRFVSLILTFVRFRVGDAAHQAVAEILR